MLTAESPIYAQLPFRSRLRNFAGIWKSSPEAQISNPASIHIKRAIQIKPFLQFQAPPYALLRPKPHLKTSPAPVLVLVLETVYSSRTPDLLRYQWAEGVSE